MKLYNRGSSFYIVINIPRKLRERFGKCQIWRSLKTKDKNIAKLRAEFELMIIKKKILDETIKIRADEDLAYADSILIDDDCEEFDSSEDIDDAELKELYDKYCKKPPLPTKTFTELEASELAHKWLIDKIKEVTGNLRKSKRLPKKYAHYKDLLNINKYFFEQCNFSQISGDMNIFFEKEFGVTVSEDSETIMLREFMKANIRMLEYAIDYMHGNNVDANPEEIVRNINYTSNRNLTYDESNKLTLVDVAELYNRNIARDNTSDEEKIRIIAKARTMNDIIGGNKLVSQISSQDIERLFRNLAFYPSNFGRNNNKSRGLATVQAIEMAKLDNSIKRISSATISSYMQTLSSIFKWAEKNEFISKNPFDKVSLPKTDRKREKPTKYLPFKTHHLKAIFSMPLYSGCQNERLGWNRKGDKIIRNTRFWIPLISLYSGARQNEICQLLTTDIKKIENVDVFCITLDDDENKKVKTVSAIRNVPVHPELIKIGFMDYVEKMRKQKHKRLFPDLTMDSRGRFSSSISKFFNRFLDEVNKTIKVEKDKLQKEHVFHSFRHTMRDALRNHGASEEVAQSIGGWDKGDSLSHHYGEGISMPNLNKEIEEKLVYDDLDLSHLYL